MLNHGVISHLTIKSVYISVLSVKMNLYDTKMARFEKTPRYVPVFSMPAGKKVKQKVSNVPLK